MVVVLVVIILLLRCVYACCAWRSIKKRAEIDWDSESVHGSAEEDFPDSVCDCCGDIDICCKTTWCTTVAEAEIAYVTSFCGFWLYFISAEAAMLTGIGLIALRILRWQTRQHLKNRIGMEYDCCYDCFVLSFTPFRLCGVCQELRYAKRIREEQQLVGTAVQTA
mmetsp:Transcript_98743/g.175778  ORF Transcript_98743/g.175778 Transcript_98743/m.175778 type:complete len:165 (+) Transcript_98743:269-763(+)